MNRETRESRERLSRLKGTDITLILSMVNALPEMEREILIDYYGWEENQPKDFKEIGRSFHQTEGKVRDVYIKASFDLLGLSLAMLVETEKQEELDHGE